MLSNRPTLLAETTFCTVLLVSVVALTISAHPLFYSIHSICKRC